MIPVQQTAARAVELTNKLGLAKGWFFRDADGRKVYHADDRMVCACTWGFMRIAVDEDVEALALLASAFNKILERKHGPLVHHNEMKGEAIVNWSDQPERTIEEVREVFQEIANGQS